MSVYEQTKLSGVWKEEGKAGEEIEERRRRRRQLGEGGGVAGVAGVRPGQSPQPSRLGWACGRREGPSSGKGHGAMGVKCSWVGSHKGLGSWEGIRLRFTFSWE